VSTRGTTNANVRGSSTSRAARRRWLVTTYRADVDLHPEHGMYPVPLGEGTPACRCYRCGKLLTVESVTADRIKPGCQGGTYVRTNIRPACLTCNSVTGGATRSARTYIRRKVGDRVGQVVLVEYLGIQGRNAYWRCVCDCGAEMRVQSGQLRTVRSCASSACKAKAA